jgi:hypothetical protein
VNQVGTGGGLLGQRSISNIGVGVSDNFVNYIFAQTPFDPNLPQATKRYFLAANSQNNGVSAEFVANPNLTAFNTPASPAAPVVPSFLATSSSASPTVISPVTTAPVQSVSALQSPMILHFLASDPFFGAILINGVSNNGQNNNSSQVTGL